MVCRAAERYPELTLHLNGGVNSLCGAREMLDDGVLAGFMVGRSMAADPWGWACADRVLYGDADPPPVRSRWNLLEKYGAHADAEEEYWGAEKIRRRVLKLLQALFAGDRFTTRFWIALDEIGGRPKVVRLGRAPAES